MTTFARSGRLEQVDHAFNAVARGETCVGIKATNGVVIAAEKKSQSVLVDESTVERIKLATKNIGITYSGMGPDFRIMTNKARKSAQEYFLEYKNDIPVSQLVREIANVAQEFTQSGGVRPFGVSLLVAGFDEQGPQLYQIDPSGSSWAWKAAAIGKAAKNAQTSLEKQYNPDMELEDAVHTALSILKENHEGALTEHNVEVGVVDKNNEFKRLSTSDIATYLQ